MRWTLGSEALDSRGEGGPEGEGFVGHQGTSSEQRWPRLKSQTEARSRHHSLGHDLPRGEPPSGPAHFPGRTGGYSPCPAAGLRAGHAAGAPGPFLPEATSLDLGIGCQTLVSEGLNPWCPLPSQKDCVPVHVPGKQSGRCREAPLDRLGACCMTGVPLLPDGHGRAPLPVLGLLVSLAGLRTRSLKRQGSSRGL